MTNFDKIMHMVGAAAAGVAITGASGGFALPTWLMIVCVAVGFGTGTITGPIKNMFGKPAEPTQ